MSHWKMTMTAHGELEIAKLRAVRARKDLDHTVDEILSRLKPAAIVGNAFSGGRDSHVNWLSVGLRLYRLRATAMTIVSIFAGIKARQNNKARKNATSRSEEHTSDLQSLMRN